MLKKEMLARTFFAAAASIRESRPAVKDSSIGLSNATLSTFALSLVAIPSTSAGVGVSPRPSTRGQYRLGVRVVKSR
jgi:hypothetical protein